MELKIFIEEKPEQNILLVRCKDLNIVTQAADREQAIRDMSALIRAHLDYAKKHNLDPISRAPRKNKQTVDQRIQLEISESRELCFA